jgi:hypothetical protein
MEGIQSSGYYRDIHTAHITFHKKPSHHHMFLTQHILRSPVSLELKPSLKQSFIFCGFIAFAPDHVLSLLYTVHSGRHVLPELTQRRALPTLLPDTQTFNHQAL